MSESDKLDKILQLLEELNDEVRLIHSRLDRIDGTQKELLTVHEAADLLCVKPYTLRTYKTQWIKNIHYFPQAKGDMYNRELLLDWQRNRHSPQAHQRAIESWVRKNQRK